MCEYECVCVCVYVFVYFCVSVYVLVVECEYECVCVCVCVYYPPWNRTPRNHEDVWIWGTQEGRGYLPLAERKI